MSTITSSCFNQHIPTSSPVLKFPASFLKTNFDQFQFTLTVQSGERSASSETFLTVTSNLIGCDLFIKSQLNHITEQNQIEVFD